MPTTRVAYYFLDNFYKTTILMFAQPSNKSRERELGSGLKTLWETS
jgi:hypothetical protein